MEALPIIELTTNHGGCGTKLYRAWGTMTRRYKSLMCDEFKTFEGFRDWAQANGYTVTSSMRRRDTKLGFYPDNLYWKVMSRYLK